MGLLPAFFSPRGGGLVVSGLTSGPPAQGPVSALAEGAKSSMFVEMPLDNRTMKEIETWSGIDARFDANLRTEDGPQNELIFRDHRRFRNIETYIRQYG